jgi:endo-1,4-beta-xylanase
MLSRLIAASFAAAILMFAADPNPRGIRLWPGAGSPVAEVAKQPDDYKTFVRVQQIHNPSIDVYLPPKVIANGMAMVVAPGGGHEFLVIEKEGTEIADWLNAKGIAVFVLKYRLARDPMSKADGKQLYGIEPHALPDALRAIRIVRAQAKEFGIDPARIGFMGFSAGAELTTLAETRFDMGNASATDPIERISSRPDFSVIVYPGPAKTEAVPANAPPAFLICSYDDRSHAIPTTQLYMALQEKRIPVEMHIFQSGGHGWALRERNLPVGQWPDLLFAWFKDRKLL